MASELRVDRIIPVNGVPTGGGGGIIQMKMGTSSTQAVSTSNTWISSGLSVTITPTRSDSKIYVQASGGMNGPAGGGSAEKMGFKINRSINGGSYSEVESSSSGQQVHYGDGDTYTALSINYLDSPGTTSPVTYKIYFRRENGSGTHSVNRDSTNQTQIIAVEVSG